MSRVCGYTAFSNTLQLRRDAETTAAVQQNRFSFVAAQIVS